MAATRRVDPPDPARRRPDRRRRPDPRPVDDHDEDRRTSTRRCSRSPRSSPPASTSCGSPFRTGRTPRRSTAIAAKSTVPVVADIHFQWKYAMAALEAGIQGLRINPGNIKYQDKVRLIAREAKARGVPIRIGVNAGSLEKDLLEKYGSADPGGPRRVRAERGADPRGRGLLRHQDLGEALEPARDDRGVPAARGEVRLPAAPRCDRGGADADGRRQERGRDRRACSPRGSATRSASRSPTIPSRRSRSARDPAVARPAQARAGPGRVSVVRPRRGRRAGADEAGQRGAGARRASRSRSASR